MNREILFRGKLIDNGEWVEGSLLLYRAGQTGIAQFHYNTVGQIGVAQFHHTTEIIHIENNEYFDITDLFYPKVNSSTIGQYTGLSDKNGTKIFEGDKVRFKRFNELYSGIVKFNQITAAFEIYYSSVVGVCGENAKHTSLICHCDDIEIIGNIHDGKDGQHDEF